MESHHHCYCCDDTSVPIHFDEVASWPKRLPRWDRGVVVMAVCEGGTGPPRPPRPHSSIQPRWARGGGRWRRGETTASRAHTQHKAISHRPMETHNLVKYRVTISLMMTPMS
ncbi:unnamed protein product [Meganyctiphanes norvegica]|uniref:Uncharacterized protein n=1 Tax=Meganyctiphanes norvegica TaxID=48144 RepID=A0AAV2QUS2_MEGNR